nr:MAG TPA: hypothetical protein [Caudoviricetes sp.]
MLKGLTSTWKNGCNAKTLTFSEYIIIDNKKIPVKAVLKDDCYNNGNFIGTFIFKEISFEVENNIDFKRKEFEYYKVVNGEAIKFGTFITTEITDNDTSELVKVVGMDFGLKTQVEYMSSLDYSSGLITLLDVWNECCELSGLTSGITDFTNSDFIVESDQFTGTGATIRDVFVAIAQSSCSFVKVMNDDKIYLIFNEATQDVVEDYTDLDDKRDTKPITCVRLGMSQIVGENLDLKNDELVKKYGEHWLIINDNPFAYTQKKREELIYAILDKIKGFGYSAFSAKTSFKPYLTCGDIIKFKNKNGELINSILLRYEHNYDEITLEAPSETSATVNYVYPANTIDLYKKAEAKVDKEANNITLLTEQTKTLRENLESDYYKKTNINELLQTAESGITNTFSEAGGNNIFRNTGLWFKADTANIQNLYNESFIYCTYNSDAVNKSLANVYPSSTSVTSYIRSEELMEINSAYEYSLDVPELTYKHGDTTLSYKTSLLELTSNREFQLEDGEILKHELSAGSSTIKFKNNTVYVMLLLENQNFSRNILLGDDLNGKTIYSSLPDNFYETLNEQAVTTSMFVKTSTSNAIGVHTQLSKGLFNVGCNTISNFEQSIMPMINFYVKNDITTVNEKSLTMSDTFGTVTEIDENNLAYPYLKIGIDTNLEIADAKTTLKELSIQIKTSDNLYEFWEGEIVRNSNDEAANNNSMLLLNGEVYQEQEVPNGNYAISFMYQKLNELANASVLINDKEYQLDSTELKQFYTGEQDNETKEYITQPVEVTTNHIRITFKCDVDNAVEIYDLMCNKGIVKLAYSQNENETTTETVNISKGITITSTNMETIFKANANGIKILTLQNATIAYFTDKGLSTKELIVEDEAQICRTLIQNVGDQTWFTRM